MLPFITAFAEGKSISHLTGITGGKWREMVNPTFSDPPENYRIDPVEIKVGSRLKTEDGKEVRIYAVDGMGYYPIHGAIKLGGGWSSDSWTVDGHNTGSGTHNDDLAI